MAVVVYEVLNYNEYGSHDRLEWYITSEYSFSFGNFSVPYSGHENLLERFESLE